MTSSPIRYIRKAGAIALAFALLASSSPMWLLTPGTAAADSTWVITSLADDGSHGTLRYAIDNSADGDTISFAEGLHGTIHLDPVLGELEILHPLTIEGPGAGSVRIDGGGEIRVLAIEAGNTSGIESPEDLLQMDPSQPPAATVVISGLTLSNGAVFSDEETLDAVGGNVLIVDSRVAFEDCVMERGEAIGGGGIAVAASLLWLDRCTIRDNSVAGLSEDVGFSSGGGGLLTLLALVVADECVFEGNISFDSADGVGLGGGITALISLCSFKKCDIHDNIAGSGHGTMGGLGGGIFALENLVLAMQDCTVADNSAGSGGQGGVGGGICVAQSFLTLLFRSLLADNTAGWEDALFAAGGGIATAVGDFSIDIPVTLPSSANLDIDPGDIPVLPPILVNCTLSGNEASAAVANDGSEPEGPISARSFGGGASALGTSPIAMVYCTVAGNSAAIGGGVSTFAVNPVGAELDPGPPPATGLLVENTIVADNSADMTNGGNDIFGVIESHLGNLIGDSQGWLGVGEPEPGDGCIDLINVDPLLGPLADNGGPTMTHLLLPGSPAIDAACDGTDLTAYSDLSELLASLGYSAIAPGALPPVGDPIQLQRDQRGDPRPVDGDGDGEARSDIGAVEVYPDISAPDISGNAASASTRVGDCRLLRVRIANEGDAVLTIYHIELSGEFAGEFTIVKDPSGQTLLPGRSTEVVLRFCPTSAGKKAITLIVYSNDPLDDPLDIMVTGLGSLKEARNEAPEPAMMGLSYLNIDPMQVLPGQEVLVSANVCNSGEERGSVTATLMVNGSAEQSQSVAVSGGSCKEVIFVVTKAIPGTYQVSVNGMQGQFSVLAPRTVQSSRPSTQYTGLGTGGLVGIAGIAVVLVTALVYVFRKE